MRPFSATILHCVFCDQRCCCCRSRTKQRWDAFFLLFFLLCLAFSGHRRSYVRVCALALTRPPYECCWGYVDVDVWMYIIMRLYSNRFGHCCFECTTLTLSIWSVCGDFIYILHYWPLRLWLDHLCHGMREECVFSWGQFMYAPQDVLVGNPFMMHEVHVNC